jgi:NADH:ubiquinone oxidoreductase subunit B-like Fe-S oxidoreductase
MGWFIHIKGCYKTRENLFQAWATPEKKITFRDKSKGILPTKILFFYDLFTTGKPLRYHEIQPLWEMGAKIACCFAWVVAQFRGNRQF